jgi:hypothetical protein
MDLRSSVIFFELAIFNLIQQKSPTSISGGMNAKMYFNQRESKLSVAEASLSVQKDLLIQIKPPADVTDFERS